MELTFPPWSEPLCHGPAWVHPSQSCPHSPIIRFPYIWCFIGKVTEELLNPPAVLFIFPLSLSIPRDRKRQKSEFLYSTGGVFSFFFFQSIQFSDWLAFVLQYQHPCEGWQLLLSLFKIFFFSLIKVLSCWKINSSLITFCIPSIRVFGFLVPREAFLLVSNQLPFSTTSFRLLRFQCFVVFLTSHQPAVE